MARAFSSVIMRQADAPSVKNEALAAVTVPCGLMKAGFNLVIFSIVESLIPLSLEIYSPPIVRQQMFVRFNVFFHYIFRKVYYQNQVKFIFHASDIGQHLYSTWEFDHFVLDLEEST